MNVCVIIPAAGSSRRFGAADKLSQDLGGRPLLNRTVELFGKSECVRSIVVAGPAGEEEFGAFRDRFGPTLGFHGVKLVEGGRVDRWETVRNALAAVPEDATHIAVHDAARPATSARLIARLFEAAGTWDAVIPVVEVTGTVKRVDDATHEADRDVDDALADDILGGDAGHSAITARRVTETVDRTNLVEVQTPQVFAAALLRRAYAAADLDGVTDDASVVERLGEPVHVIEGDRRNIKVTSPEDIELVRAILGAKAPAERPVHKRF